MLKIIRRVLSVSGKYRNKLLFSFAMSFLENSMSVLSMAFIFLSFGRMIDGTVTRTEIWWLGAALFAAVVFRYLFKLLEYMFQSGTGYEIVCDERLKLGEKLLHLSMGFYSNTDAGNISSVINNDLVFVEGMAMSFVSKVTGAIISAVLVAGFLFVMDWRVALIACTSYPLAWLANRFIQRTLIKHSVRRQEAHADTSSIMLEYLQGIYVIKAFRLAGKQNERLEGILRRLEVESYDFEMKSLPWIGLYLISFHLGTALILGMVAFLMPGSGISMTTALLFVTMTFTFYAPMELLGLSSGFIRLLNACLDRMQEIMDYPVMDKGGSTQSPVRFDVAFDHVSFSYKSSDAAHAGAYSKDRDGPGDDVCQHENQVLKDISFCAPEHTMTAFIGPSGSGKTTLLNLIARFWDAGSGSIQIGGIDIKTLKCETVMANISAVFQKAYLFHDSIYNNIIFGNPQATREQVVEAAKKAHCHEFIMGFEQGYETVIGEAGYTLSGGERQRISIARALLKDAPIILLDEVTANIDPENEQLIQQALNELVADRTVFVVAHKLATIRNAHQIIVLNGSGTIDGAGTHEELYGHNVLYTTLWEKSQKISSWSINTQ